MAVSYASVFLPGANIGGLGSVPGAPARLDFTTPPPANIGTGATFNTSVRVSDKFGNQIVNFPPFDTITLSKASGPVGGVFSCTGGNIVGTLGGTAFFTGCSFNLAGTYSLIATSNTGYTPAVSGSIVVGPVVSSSYLQFSVQPGGGQPNVAWTQQPQIVVRDTATNQVITGFSGTVSLSIASGPGAGYPQLHRRELPDIPERLRDLPGLPDHPRRHVHAERDHRPAGRADAGDEQLVQRRRCRG